MRWPLVMLVLAACGDTQEGALLVVEAPDGATASRLEILLASADPAMISEVPGQRVSPHSLDAEAVRYYRQRAITGELEGVGTLDGFAVRLEPNADIPEPSLIPVLVGFDEQDQISAIGAVMEGGLPVPVEIAEGQLLRFVVTMTTAAPAGDDGIAANEVLGVTCGDFLSGIAWRPGPSELRLVLADRGSDPAATDARARPLDLDCDGDEASLGDCDDLRGEFHPGAVETCDGIDLDCDLRGQELVTCDLPNACGATGVGICNDRPGSPGVVACQAEPACACETGACAQCVVAFEPVAGTPEVAACSPSFASHLVLPECEGGCTVEVLRRQDDPFKIKISLPDAGNFGDKLTGVVDKIDLRAEALDRLTASGGSIVGAIFLAVVRPNGATTQVSLVIRLEEQSSVCVPDANLLLCTRP